MLSYSYTILCSILGKKTVVTEEEIDAVTHQIAVVGLDTKNKMGSVRRLAARGKRSS